MNKKGFTLIELLAVIIILGILMIIAIPSVTKYISDSRKNAYIDTAKEIISGARNVVNQGRLEMYSTDTTYYIPSSCIKVENGEEAESPYGKFTKAYVGVIYNGDGYKYYWISVDDSGQGIKEITPLDKLETDLIESDLKDSDIEDTVKTTGIGERSEIYILNCKKESWETQIHLDDISNNASEENGGGSTSGNSGSGYANELAAHASIVSGDINNLQIGDEICWETECFYVIGSNQEKTQLITKYNLYVGNIYVWSVHNNNYDVTYLRTIQSTEEGYGLQNSTALGNVDESNGALTIGTISFSNTNYWSSDNYDSAPYVYNENSNLYNYVQEYTNNLKNYYIKINNISSRLFTYNDAVNIGCTNIDQPWIGTCPNFIKGVSFWMGNAGWSNQIYRMYNTGSIDYDLYTNDFNYGIRPVIEIPTSSIN